MDNFSIRRVTDNGIHILFHCFNIYRNSTTDNESFAYTVVYNLTNFLERKYMKDRMQVIVKELREEFPDSEKSLSYQTPIKFADNEEAGIIRVKNKEGHDIFYAVMTEDTTDEEWLETHNKLRTMYK